MAAPDLVPYTGEIERTAPLLPMRVEDARAAMDAYQELTGAVLAPSDWIGAPGEPESFVKRSGWQKLATFYAVSTELVGDTILERDADGNLIRAAARARAIDTRTGRHADGGGACGRNEPRFANARGRQKIEHDLPATAETRAQNRAVSNLIGYGAVSAEEIDGDVRGGGPDLPDWAHDVPDDAVDRLGANLEAILEAAGVDEPGRAALEVGNAVTNYCGGVFPIACARLARLLARVISQTAPAEADVVEAELVVDGETVDPPDDGEVPADATNSAPAYGEAPDESPEGQA